GHIRILASTLPFAAITSKDVAATRNSPLGFRRRRRLNKHGKQQSNERETEMGKIVISENVSLDGVVEDPTGEEGFRHGGWGVQRGDRDREAWAKVNLDEALGAEALLLGRRSDAFFGARFASRSGEWADRLNS